MADRIRMPDSDLTVVLHDNVMRYRVGSRTRPGIEHVVDIASWSGIGECSCEHFQYRILPGIRINVEGREANRCKHIKVAREFALDVLIEHFRNHHGQE